MIAQGSGGSIRDVIFRLKLEADEANKRAAETLSGQAKAAYDEANKNRINGAKQTTRAVAAEEMKLSRETLRELDRWEKEQQRIQVTRIRATERATTAQIAANERIRGSLKETLEGVTSLARGFVYLGISNEESLQKALKVLVKFEAGIAILRGTLTLIKFSADAWKAYKVAVEAAAAADVIKAGTGALAAGSSIPGGAAGVKGLALNTVGAAGKAVSFVASSPPTLIALGVAAAAAAAALDGLRDATRKEEESKRRLDASIEGPATRARAERERLSQVNKFAEDQRAVADQLSLSGSVRGLRGDARDRAGINEQLLTARARAGSALSRLRQLENPDGSRAVDVGTNAAQREDAAQKARTALQALIPLVEKQVQLEANITSHKAQQARAAQDSLRNLAEQNRIEAERAAGRIDDAGERFGALSPADQARALAALRAVEAGTATRQQEKLASGFSEAGDEEIRRQRIRRAQEAGFFDAGLVRRDDDRALDAGQNAFNIAVQAQTQNQIAVQLEARADAGAVADEIARQIEPRLKEILGTIASEKTAAEIIKKLEERLKAQQKNQARAGG